MGDVVISCKLALRRQLLKCVLLDRMGKSCKCAGSRDLFRDEQGMTSVGMAVSLLICMALMFSGAQVYRSMSAAAEVQEVADAAALAAENEVAEFMVAVSVCDATVLSMTLLGATVFGIGAVSACVPPLAGISGELIALGEKVVSARDRFLESASAGLDSLQRVLPLLSAASASNVAKANSSGAAEGDYTGLAVLVPAEGDAIGAPDDGLSSVGDELEESADCIRDKAACAEELAQNAGEAKQRAFLADCGSAPDRCQYERAQSLSSIDAHDNPLYSSVDAWSFSVALERAKSYYSARLADESSLSPSNADIGGHAFRMRFYQYACSELSGAYAHEDGSGVSLCFPKLFHNMDEFRSTELYVEAVYPLSAASGEGDRQTIHSCSDCPEVTAIVGWGSMMQLDSGAYDACDRCQMSVEGLGNVAAASTNVPTGFEHHYEVVRAASVEYQSAMDELAPVKSEVEEAVTPIFDLIGDLISEVGGKRISTSPPGSSGCIAMVVNNARPSADAGFETSLVGGSSSLGACAAVSGAALIEDTSHENSSLITSLLDGFDGDGGAAVGSARIALDVWSGLLKAYEDGQTALADALEKGLGSVSIGTVSGLGEWASEALSAIVGKAGLEPANLKASKAVLLNTGYVASVDAGAFSVAFSKAKSSALSASSSSPDVLTGVVSSVADDAIAAIGDATITIAVIEFPVGDGSIPIEISLPEGVKSGAEGIVARIRDSLADLVAGASGMRVWQ